MTGRPHIPRIVLAPMAGGPTTVELAAAVCEAGGLGFLAAGYLDWTRVADQVDQLRALTSAPFGVNLFVIREDPVDEERLRRYLEAIAPDADRLGCDLGAPRFDDDGFDPKVAALLEAKVPVVSFAIGCPPVEVVRALQQGDTSVWVTVTSLADAELAIATGCDALVAQGAEAGGHRSAFVDDGGLDAPTTIDLVRALSATTDVPVIAAGGIATAGDVRAVIDAGASAAQCGTAFLLADEAGTHQLHRDALTSGNPTAFTRAYTGRTARGIETRFMRDHPDAPSAYPHVHHATSAMRTAARETGDPECMSLWAGTRHALARSAPAAEIVRALHR